jgi:dihydroorotate dehydrogenase
LRASFLSICYRSARFIITKTLYFFQALFFRPKDLESAVIGGDSFLSTISIIGAPFFNFKIPSGNDIEVFGLEFPSPLVAASFKSETEILNIWLQMGLGGAIFKTIMKNERLGNKRPRLQDASLAGKKGLLNSMGLPGKGIEYFAAEIADLSLWNFDRPLGVSVGGDSIFEYVESVNRIEGTLKNKSISYFYELNVSCPNTINGQTIGDDPLELEKLLNELRSNMRKPISVKVSPDLSNETLIHIGEICSDINQVFINAGNTQYKKSIDVGVETKHFIGEGGGFSGPALFDRTLEMVKLFSDFDLPIMATGGISKIHHIEAAKENGASLFGLATALVLDPYCVPKINKRL